MRKFVNLLENKKQIKEDQVSLRDQMVERLKTADKNDFWSIVHAIGWGSETTDSDLIKSALREVFTPTQIERLDNKAVEFRKALQTRIWQYEKEHGIVNLYGVGDDGFWDVTAHVVGLGKDFYSQVMKDPGSYSGRGAVENFEYSFSKY